MGSVFQFDSLADADLIVDAVYEGGRKGNTGDDPLGKLILAVGQGGFLDRSWDAPWLRTPIAPGIS